MKGSKIKILTIVLAIVLVALVSFIGVYTKVQNRMENQVKNYGFAMDINGARHIQLKVSQESEEVVKDSNGNKVQDADNLTDDEISEKGYTKETEKDNPDDVLTKENYRISKEIIEERLKSLGAQEYKITLNEDTGTISVELDEDVNYTDDIVNNLAAVSKFQILDSETNEVLMDNDDIENVQVLYGSGSTTTQGTSVYLSIQFDKEGTKKLEEISSKYTPNANQDGTNTNETSTNETSANETSTNEASTDGTSTDDTTSTEKKVTLQIDGSTMMSTSFEQVIKNGVLQMSYGNASTDTATINENAEKANSAAMILRNKVMPIKYTVDENKYIQSNITKDNLQKFAIVFAVIVAIALGVLIFRYKLDGVYTAISYVGFAALILLLIRYTNTILSIEGIVAIGIVLALNYLFTQKILKLKNDDKTENAFIKETYKSFLMRIIPLIIISIVFCFIKWIPIISFGVVLFWGIVLMLAYNYLVTGTLLKLNIGGTNNEK